MMPKKPANDDDSGHGMTPEEAIQKMFAAGSERAMECPHCGGELTVNLVDEQSEFRCPKCGGFTTYERNQS
jgi:predicted RNA-binding Zn-ribbon protein involved in translation (DUF1610 family)